MTTPAHPSPARRSPPAPGVSSRAQRLTAIVCVVGLLAVLAWAFTAGRREQAAERAREAPVVQPSRVQAVGDAVGIVLDRATQARMGIATQPVGLSSQAGTITLTGALAEDPGQVTTVRAPLAGRLTLPPSARWPGVGEAMRPGQVLGQVSDARPLAAPRRGTVTAVGAQPGELVQPWQMLLTFVDFDRLLARVVWQAGAPAVPPRKLTVGPLGSSSDASSGASSDGSLDGTPGGPLVRATLVGAAVAVDTLTRAPVFLYRLAHAWLGARPGLPITATLADPRTRARGVFVPTAAVVQWNALAWVYVERAPGRYVRVRLDTTMPVDGGWLAAGQGAGTALGVLAVGDRVVVRGAEQLLSEEFRASTTSGGTAPAAAASGDPDRD